MSDENIINENIPDEEYKQKRKSKLHIPYKTGTKEYGREYRKIKREESKKVDVVLNIIDNIDIEKKDDLIQILNNKKEELEQRDKKIKNLLYQIMKLIER